MQENLTIGLAFIAGLLSFVSPCVLPLVPAYIGYMGGRMTRGVAIQTVGMGKIKTEGATTFARVNLLIHGLAFVLGFTTVFVVIGLATTAFVSVLGNFTTTVTEIISRLGGALIIVFGLHFMGFIPKFFAFVRARPALIHSPLTALVVGALLSWLLWWGFVGSPVAFVAIAALWLGLVIGGATSQPATFWEGLMGRIETAVYSDTRREMTMGKQSGLGSSFLMGVVFSAGWTPCIGPIYGAVLTLAANTGDVGAAAPLLTAYSLGLGIPFMLTALLVEQAQGVLRRLQKHMHTIETLAGSLMIIIGLLVATGQLQILSRDLGNSFADVSTRIEECGVGFFEGKLAFNQVGSCLGGTLIVTNLNQSAGATLAADAQAQIEFVIAVPDAGTVDVELRNLPADFLPSVTLLSPDGIELGRSSSYAPDERGHVIVISQVDLASGGNYRVIVQHADEAAPLSADFRLRLNGERPS